MGLRSNWVLTSRLISRWTHNYVMVLLERGERRSPVGGLGHGGPVLGHSIVTQSSSSVPSPSLFPAWSEVGTLPSFSSYQDVLPQFLEPVMWPLRTEPETNLPFLKLCLSLESVKEAEALSPEALSRRLPLGSCRPTSWLERAPCKCVWSYTHLLRRIALDWSLVLLLYPVA